MLRVTFPRFLLALFLLLPLAAVHPAAAQTLFLTHTLRHKDVSCAVFSPDGKTLATGGGDWATPDCVRLWDVRTGRLLRTLRDRRDDWNIAGIAFSPNAHAVAYACDDKVRLWDARTGRLLRVFSGNLIGGVEFSPHNRLLVGGSSMYEDGDWSEASVWDLRTGAHHVLPKSRYVSLIRFSPDGMHLIGISSGDGGEVKPFVRRWNAGTRKVEWTHALPRKTLSLGLSVDGRTLAAGVWDAKPPEPITVWDASTGRRLPFLHGPHHIVNDADFAPQAPWLITGGGDEDTGRGELLLWDRRNGRRLFAAPVLPGVVTATEFSSDGRRLVTASGDGTVRLWHVR